MEAVVTGYADAEQKGGRLQRVYTIEARDDRGRTVDRQTVHFKLHKPQSSTGVAASLGARKQKMLEQARNAATVDWDAFVDASS